MNIFQRIKKTPAPHTPDVASSFTPMDAIAEMGKAVTPPEPPKYPRLSVNMSNETSLRLKWLTEELHTSATDVVGQAIEALAFLLQEQNNDGAVQVRFKSYTQTYRVGIKR